MDRKEKEAEEIDNCYQSLNDDQQEIKDWDINDAPSNEIDWNEVDYFDYINQKEDETSPE